MCPLIYSCMNKYKYIYRDGLTAIHCAASRGHTECIDTLIGLCGAPTDLIGLYIIICICIINIIYSVIILFPHLYMFI